MELSRLRAQLARVTMERDILKKATAYFARESLSEYAWIASNKAHWPISLACEVLGVNASGYFEHGRRKKFPKPSKPGAHKRMSDEALLAYIRAIHAQVKGEYGWPKMWKELVARGHRVGKERVRRLMQLLGIRARCKRKFVVITSAVFEK